MAESETNDDVLSLCAHVNYSTSHYKRFRPNLPGVSERGSILKPKSDAGEMVQYPLTKLSETQQNSFSQPPVLLRREPASRKTSLALTRLYTAVAKARPKQTQVLPIISVAGKCGATTILTTLGRALSILGENVLLAEYTGAPTPTLPLLYSAPAGQQGLVSLRSAGNPFEGTLHVLRNCGSALALHHFANELSAKLDHVLVGTDPFVSESMGEVLSTAGACLVVVTPEPESLSAIDRVSRRIAELEQKRGCQIVPHYVLNRFNASIPLHVAARNRLRDQLGAQLLSIHLPQSSAVSEALAEGAVIVDTAPWTADAGAFFSLAEWCRSAGVRTSTESMEVRESVLVQSAHG